MGCWNTNAFWSVVEGPSQENSRGGRRPQSSQTLVRVDPENDVLHARHPPVLAPTWTVSVGNANCEQRGLT